MGFTVFALSQTGKIVEAERVIVVIGLPLAQLSLGAKSPIHRGGRPLLIAS